MTITKKKEEEEGEDEGEEEGERVRVGGEEWEGGGAEIFLTQLLK